VAAEPPKEQPSKQVKNRSKSPVGSKEKVLQSAKADVKPGKDGKVASKTKKPSKSPALILHAADSLLGIVEVSEDKQYVQTALVKVSIRLLVGLPISLTKASLGQARLARHQVHGEGASV